METNFKSWEKSAEGSYLLFKKQEQLGTMTIQNSLLGRTATLRLEGQDYRLKQTGFWKNNIEITNAAGTVVLKTYAEKWYSSATVIEVEGKKLKLVVRNSPLASYVIVDGNRELLSYGLVISGGKPTIEIRTTSDTPSYLLDCYLWYLFVPVAQENMGDDFTFLMLLIA